MSLFCTRNFCKSLICTNLNKHKFYSNWKVVSNENKGPRERGKCQVLVSDRANRSLFVVWTCCFCAKIVISFSLLIGLIIDDFFTIGNAHWIFFRLFSQSAFPIHTQAILCSNTTIFTGRVFHISQIFFIEAPSPIVNKIAYYLANTEGKRKYVFVFL